MPALQSRMSSREDCEVNFLPAAATELREARSHWIKSILVPGTAVLTSSMALEADFWLRPVK